MASPCWLRNHAASCSRAPCCKGWSCITRMRKRVREGPRRGETRAGMAWGAMVCAEGARAGGDSRLRGRRIKRSKAREPGLPRVWSSIACKSLENPTDSRSHFPGADTQSRDPAQPDVGRAGHGSAILAAQVAHAPPNQPVQTQLVHERTRGLPTQARQAPGPERPSG